MAVLNTHISWTDTTWNPTTGCTKVSDGCRYCYAEALTNRLFGGGFENVTTHPARLKQVKSFGPIRDADGSLKSRLVFVNSMSDLHHQDIPDAFRHQVYDAIEAMPDTIFQVLTKRTVEMRRFIADRYGNSGVPENLWLGTSVENDAQAGRINILRKLRDRVGACTLFLSVEPLIGDPGAHDYTGIDQVLIGGESPQKVASGGPMQFRPMHAPWPRKARDKARAAGSALWFKQWGHWSNNPLYQQAPAGRHIDRVRWAIAHGEREARIEIDPATGRETVAGEKGGATLDGEVLHELPPAFDRIKERLNPVRRLAV